VPTGGIVGCSLHFKGNSSYQKKLSQENRRADGSALSGSGELEVSGPDLIDFQAVGLSSLGF
jgi:hypothetical protein